MTQSIVVFAKFTKAPKIPTQNQTNLHKATIPY